MKGHELKKSSVLPLILSGSVVHSADVLLGVLIERCRQNCPFNIKIVFNDRYDVAVEIMVLYNPFLVSVIYDQTVMVDYLDNSTF